MSDTVTVYHCISFASVDEGAAFAAALSRALASPAGVSGSAVTGPIEVLVAAPAGAEGLRVFLSTAALDATHAIFGAPAVVESGGAEMLPPHCAAVVRDADRAAYGKDDIMRRIPPSQ